MKKKLKFFVLFLYVVISASSCGEGEKSVSQIKLIPVKNGKEFRRAKLKLIRSLAKLQFLETDWH